MFNKKTFATRVLLNSVLLSSSVSLTQPAFARGERVMGATGEGAVLRSAYIQKMDKIDQDKKQCRKDIAEIIAPQMALLDEFGQAGHAGPSRSVKDEAQLQAESAKLAQLQSELVRLGKWINQNENKSHPQFNANLRQFEKRLRDFSLAQKGMDTVSNSLLERSERAVKNFVPFAQAVLKVKKMEACEDIWADLRASLPRNMEQVVLKNRARIKQQVAAARGEYQNFGMFASKLILKFKTKSQVAAEDLEL